MKPADVTAANLKALVNYASKTNFFMLPGVEDDNEPLTLTPQQFFSLMSALQQNQNLVMIKLSYSQRLAAIVEMMKQDETFGPYSLTFDEKINLKFTQQQVKQLLEQARPHPQLLGLDLSNCPMNSLMQSLSTFLNTNRSVNLLSLNQCGIPTAEFQQLVQTLAPQRTPFEKIELSENQIDGVAMTAFINKMPLQAKAWIDLSGCKMGDEGMQLILAALGNKKATELTLQISDNNLTDAICPALAALMSKGVVTHVLAYQNELTDRGLQVLCETIQQFQANFPGRKMQLECVVGNHFSAQGITQLQSCVQLNAYSQDHGRIVLMSDVTLTREFLIRVLEPLHDRKVPLLAISFEQCRIDEQSFSALALLLERVPCHQIRFIDTPLTSGGLIAILSRIKNSREPYPHLRTFIVKNGGLSDDGLQFFLDSRSCFPNLSRLDFSDNDFSDDAKQRLHHVQNPPGLLSWMRARIATLWQSSEEATELTPLLKSGKKK